jgi:AraC-like DNA-binding protein
MWLTPDRLLYVGLMGAPTTRTMGAVSLYVALEGVVEVRLGDGEWQSAELAVIQPYVAHQVRCHSRHILVIHIEAESVRLDALRAPLRANGVGCAPELVRRIRWQQCAIRAQLGNLDLDTASFDERLFGAPLPLRVLEPRIRHVVDLIKTDPSAMLGAEECAARVHLSFSRFLHLFRQEVGAPFRSFRTWKRARSLLQYVNQDINLSHVAVEAGYADSTHLSHSIRQIYGLRPRDMFAGSRGLAIVGSAVQSMTCRSADRPRGETAGRSRGGFLVSSSGSGRVSASR